MIINTQKVKTALLHMLGEGFTASLHGMRFAWLLKCCDRKLDPEMQLLPKFLGDGDAAVDVGANGADWTLYISNAVGARGSVFAFEADPYYEKATRSAIRWLGLKQVIMFPFGLSDKNEDVPLRVIDESGMRESGLGHVDRSASAQDEGVRLINLKTLDSLVQEYPELKKTALIKCDVEGYELFVLRGAEAIVTKSRPVLILETEAFERQGYSASDMSEYLYEKGYGSYAMVEGGRLRPVGADLVCGEAMSINRVFIHNDKLDSMNLDIEKT